MALSCDDYINLTQRYFPELNFARLVEGSLVRNEPFYPADPAGWITHRALDPSAANPHRRGTSLHIWDVDSDWIDTPDVRAPGELALDDGSNGIGHTDLASRPPSGKEWFLNFGGWFEPSTKGQGQLGYTWQRYDEAVNSPQGLDSSQPSDFEPGSGPGQADRFAPSPGLHAYAAFRPLEGIINELLDVELPPELDEFRAAGRTVPEDLGDLKDNPASMVALDYYLFYPASITTYTGGSQKHREGVWELVSIYLKDTEGRGELDDYEIAYASYSRGWKGGLFPFPSDPESRPKADMELNGTHPMVYVAYGSHANFFHALDEPFSSPETDTVSEVDWGYYGWQLGFVALFLVAAIILIIVGILLIKTGGWALIAVGIALLLLAIIFAVQAGFQLGEDLTDGGPEPEPQPFDAGQEDRVETHDGSGPNGGGDQAVPFDPSSAPPAGQVVFYNHPIADDPSIDDPTGKCRPPVWWTFTGRWGTSVAREIALRPNDVSGWKNGTWRKVADRSYSLTHRNAEALFDFLTAPA
jgi:hypothetical protein